MAKAKGKNRSPSSRAPSAKQKRDGAVWWKILLVLLILALLVGAAVAIWYYRDELGGIIGPDDGPVPAPDAPQITATVNGEIYKDSAEGLCVYPDTDVEISAEGAEWSYKICALPRSIAYTVGEEKYNFSDLAGRDLTGGFSVTKLDGGIRIGYENFKKILEAYHGRTVAVDPAATLEGDLFELVVNSGGSELRLAFGIGLPVSGLVVDPDHHIF